MSEVVGIGAKWDTSPPEEGTERDHAVAVYVVSEARYKESSEQIPESVTIPARKGEHVIRVVIEEIGELAPESEFKGESDEPEGFLIAE